MTVWNGCTGWGKEPLSGFWKHCMQGGEFCEPSERLSASWRRTNVRRPAWSFVYYDHSVWPFSRHRWWLTRRCHVDGTFETLVTAKLDSSDSGQTDITFLWPELCVLGKLIFSYDRFFEKRSYPAPGNERFSLVTVIVSSLVTNGCAFLHTTMSRTVRWLIWWARTGVLAAGNVVWFCQILIFASLCRLLTWVTRPPAFVSCISWIYLVRFLTA